MSEFPHLQNFLAAYFHQDWQAEHATADAVVAFYRDSEAPAQVDATRRELGHLLARDDDDATLGDAARALGCEYDPTRDGGRWRDWLQQVRAGLAGDADASSGPAGGDADDPGARA